MKIGESEKKGSMASTTTEDMKMRTTTEGMRGAIAFVCHAITLLITTAIIVREGLAVRVKVGQKCPIGEAGIRVTHANLF